jgi:hypothetical protein
MALGSGRHDRAGPVHGASVCDDDLVAVGGIVLAEHRIEARLDVPLLVEDGDDDADER